MESDGGESIARSSQAKYIRYNVQCGWVLIEGYEALRDGKLERVSRIGWRQPFRIPGIPLLEMGRREATRVLASSGPRAGAAGLADLRVVPEPSVTVMVLQDPPGDIFPQA